MSETGRLIAGRYRLGPRIGSGAMGVVWQALDERLHRTVAVKQLLLSPGLTAAQSEEARQRAMREGRIAARLQHASAITVYDVTEDDGQPWLIMEYLASRSLADMLAASSTLSPQQAAGIGAQVAGALAAAHAAGIVHRDVKPANVLIAEDGTVKITDFGISRAVGDVTVTATGMLAGTPAYLAPEMAKGEYPAPPSDVFSLGSTLYAAVEGRPPFGTSDNPLALLHAVAAGNVTPPRQAGQLTALLMQLLRSDPQQRPTMSEARDALRAIADGQLPQVSPNPPVQARKPAVSQQPATRLDVRPLSNWSEGAAAPGAAAAGAAAASGSGQRPNWRTVLLAALAVVIAAAVGILVAIALMGGSGNDNAAGAAPLTSRRAPPSTTLSTAPTTTPTTPPPTTTAAVTPADVEQTVRRYYGLLPANTSTAWTMLTASEQQQSGGYGQYQKFWSRISKVSVGSVKPHGKRTVLADLHFTTTSHHKTHELYSITVTGTSSTDLKINSAKHVSSHGHGHNGGDGGH
ncbi:MAG: serine/threonine-protein kinase [Sciscionella sp.]